MGIDRILDMTRTAVNITGDEIAITIVAHQNGALDKTCSTNQIQISGSKDPTLSGEKKRKRLYSYRKSDMCGRLLDQVSPLLIPVPEHP